MSTIPCDNLDQSTCTCEGCVDDGQCIDMNAMTADGAFVPIAPATASANQYSGDGICNPYGEDVPQRLRPAPPLHGRNRRRWRKWW